MRYPRAFILFDSQLSLPDENFFQSISGAERKIYLNEVTKPIRTIKNSISKITSFDDYLNKPYFDTQVLVISNFSIVDFISAYLSDKNPRIYWLDSHEDEKKLESCLNGLSNLDQMKYYLKRSISHYVEARLSFSKLIDQKLHDPERYITEYQALAYYKTRTSVESEIRVYLKSLLSYGMINRIDLR
jgi:hypothetical protein